MLVITRKPGEGFFVGDDIKVTILGMDRGQVKVGIEAPKDVAIAREELRNDSPKHKRNR